jgi:hypothetical protein
LSYNRSCGQTIRLSCGDILSRAVDLQLTFRTFGYRLDFQSIRDVCGDCRYDRLLTGDDWADETLLNVGRYRNARSCRLKIRSKLPYSWHREWIHCWLRSREHIGIRGHHRIWRYHARDLICCDDRHRTRDVVIDDACNVNVLVYEGRRSNVSRLITGIVIPRNVRITRSERHPSNPIRLREWNERNKRRRVDGLANNIARHPVPTSIHVSPTTVVVRSPAPSFIGNPSEPKRVII